METRAVLSSQDIQLVVVDFNISRTNHSLVFDVAFMFEVCIHLYYPVVITVCYQHRFVSSYGEVARRIELFYTSSFLPTLVTSWNLGSLNLCTQWDPKSLTNTLLSLLIAIPYG